MFSKFFKQNRILKNKIWLLELEVNTLKDNLRIISNELTEVQKEYFDLKSSIDSLAQIQDVDNLKTPKNTRSCWPLSWHKKP